MGTARVDGALRKREGGPGSWKGTRVCGKMGEAPACRLGGRKKFKVYDRWVVVIVAQDAKVLNATELCT